jgi:hypothetical protein
MLLQIKAKKEKERQEKGLAPSSAARYVQLRLAPASSSCPSNAFLLCPSLTLPVHRLVSKLSWEDPAQADASYLGLVQVGCSAAL